MEFSGYIYVRNNSSYEKDNVRKLGKTTNLAERDNQYVTGEYRLLMIFG